MAQICQLNGHSISIKMKWIRIHLGKYEILADWHVLQKKLRILLFSLLPNFLVSISPHPLIKTLIF